MLRISTAATFLAAALLFAIEPFAARQVLPIFGGSPAVWNTAVMFFQVCLLAGYVYAHLLTTRLPRRAQVATHLAVLALAALLPVGIDADAPAGGTGQAGVWELLVLLARGVGLPFFAVATAGPLLQRWFADTTHRSAGDPYFLYAASNAGSFVGLLAYPLVIERVWSLPEQAAWWRGGFVGVGLLIFFAGLAAPRGPDSTPDPTLAPRDPAHATAGTADPGGAGRIWRERAWWVFLALVPSSLMLGVTQYLSTDLAAVPLLWVLPLGIYLLTFVAAFSRFGDLVARAAARAWPMAVAAVVLAFLLQARQPILAIIGLHLAVLAAAGCLCHGRLRAARPGVARLTEFYLCLAVGGALGGVCNSLIAPVVFNNLHEYPAAIALACLAMPRATAAPRTAASPAERLRPRALWLVPIALLAWVWLGPRTNLTESGTGQDIRLFAVVGLPVLALFLLSKRRVLFTAATAAMLLAIALRSDGSRIELRERSFFGIHTVRIDADARFRQLGHGVTIHGMAWLDPAKHGEPLTYYHRQGPAGQVFTRFGDRFDRAAFIGLGAGSLAAYAREGQRFDFYEIDPAVVRIASNPEFFPFLADSPAEVSFVIGDGRLMLGRAAGSTYDLIVLDAFSSDAVPMHLLTREAFEVYASKLKPDALLLVHLSNLHLHLGPFVAAGLRDAGLVALERRDERSLEQQTDLGQYQSHWMVASRDAAALVPLARDVQWATPGPAARAWTDAHADLVAALLAE